MNWLKKTAKKLFLLLLGAGLVYLVLWAKIKLVAQKQGIDQKTESEVK